MAEYYNNTVYKNGQHGFDMYAYNIPFIFRNNIAFANTSTQLSNVYPVNSSNNSWDAGYSVSSSDFASLDTTGISGPRQANGNLPVLNFLKLNSSSPLYTGATDLGLGLGTKMGFSYSVVIAPYNQASLYFRIW